MTHQDNPCPFDGGAKEYGLYGQEYSVHPETQ
jgi:hypothetical protein